MAMLNNQRVYQFANHINTPLKKGSTGPSIMPRIAQFSLVLPVVELHPGVNVDLRQQGYVVQFFCSQNKKQTNRNHSSRCQVHFSLHMTIWIPYTGVCLIFKVLPSLYPSAVYSGTDRPKLKISLQYYSANKHILIQ